VDETDAGIGRDHFTDEQAPDDAHALERIAAMARGTIKNLVSDRGFGFIVPEGKSTDGKNLFFHRNDVQGTTPYEQLRIGIAVEYDLGRDERRGTPIAINVRSIPE
jgi:cold shock CspA family protein